jgi:protein-tyrosine phosphatase
MVDIHCHLLPGIDDGSDDPLLSLEQLRTMADGGIRQVFLTSHYLKGHYEYSREDYDSRLEYLRSEAQSEGLDISLHPGFEVFIQPNILQDIKAKRLTMGDSQFVLIESDLNGLPYDFYNNVYPLLRAGYKPILAHAERYVSIMKSPKEARSLTERNIYIQVNAGSLLGGYGEKVRQTAWTLVNYGWAHFLASDDHVRGPYSAYFDAVGMIREQLDDHAAELITKIYPREVVENGSIPYSYVYVHDSRHHHSRRHHFRLKRLLKKIFL